jgi:hypothetical protein
VDVLRISQVTAYREQIVQLGKYCLFSLLVSVGVKVGLWSSGQELLSTEWSCIVLPVRYELDSYVLYRRM